MKANRIIRSLLVAATALLMASCYGDKGNYDYAAINEVSISGIDEEYVVKIGNGITITPDLSQSIGVDESSLTYEWIWMGGKGQEAYTVISTDRELNDFSLPLTAGEHKMLYRVTDTATGVQWTSDYFKMIIENDIARGLLVLCDDQGATRLLHINYPLGMGSTFRKMEVSLFELPELGRPLTITTYPDWQAPYLNTSDYANQYGIVLHTETGAYRLRASDLHYQDNYNLKYMFTADMPADWSMKQLIPSRDKQTSQALILDNDNNLLEYSMVGSMLMWTPDQYANVNTAGKIIPTTGKVVFRIMPWQYGGFFFMDEQTRSFWGRDGWETACTQFPDKPATANFSYRNTDSDLLFMTNTQTGRIYVLLKNRTSGDIKLAAFPMMAKGGYSEPLIDQTLYPTSPATGGAALPGIRDAIGYALVYTNTTGKTSLFYYATATDVYVYNMYDYSIKSVYSAPSGSQITMIKMMDFWPVTDNLLVVTRDAGKSASESDAITIFSITETYGDLTVAKAGPIGAEEELHWSGLPHVVGVDWKQQ